MKKSVFVAVAMVVAVSFAACGGKKAEEAQVEADSLTTVTAVEEVVEVADSTANAVVDSASVVVAE